MLPDTTRYEDKGETGRSLLKYVLSNAMRGWTGTETGDKGHLTVIQYNANANSATFNTALR